VKPLEEPITRRLLRGSTIKLLRKSENTQRFSGRNGKRSKMARNMLRGLRKES
jgi:hypothetical protein